VCNETGPGGHVAGTQAGTKRAHRDSNLLSVDMHTEPKKFVLAEPLPLAPAALIFPK
jgi:threonine dehydrogenase-like Zn-dependent dehydrogenase